MKVCSGCEQSQPDENFYSSGHGRRCKECFRQWHRSRYTPKADANDDPRPCRNCGVVYQPKQRKVSYYCSRQCGEEYRAKSGQQRDRHLKRKYGISLGDYERMLDAQGGGCAICGKRPDEQMRYDRYLHVDHDHETGEVRGLLCDQHNLLLGRFNDDPELMRRAADYLDGQLAIQGVM